MSFVRKFTFAISSPDEFLVIPYERSFGLVVCEEEWLVGGDLFYLKFWVTLTS